MNSFRASMLCLLLWTGDILGQSTLLVAAAGKADIAGVRSLLAAGADPNEVDNAHVKGWTPLMAAAKARSAEVAEAILKAHAHVNAATEYGATALDIAIAIYGNASTLATPIEAAGGKGREHEKQAGTRLFEAAPSTARSEGGASASGKHSAADPSSARKAFIKSEIVELLNLATPDALMMPQIRAAGIDFVARQADLGDFARMGASDALLGLLREASTRFKAAEDEALIQQAETLSWRDAEKQPNRLALESYLRHFPNGPNAIFAKQRLDEIARRDTVAEDTLTSVAAPPKELARRPHELATLVVSNTEISFGSSTFFVDGRPIVKIRSLREATLKVEPGIRQLQIGLLKSAVVKLDVQQGQIIKVYVIGGQTSHVRILGQNDPRANQLIQRRTTRNTLRHADNKDILARDAVIM
jgi:hypothetical protein